MDSEREFTMYGGEHNKVLYHWNKTSKSYSNHVAQLHKTKWTSLYMKIWQTFSDNILNFVPFPFLYIILGINKNYNVIEYKNSNVDTIISIKNVNLYWTISFRGPRTYVVFSTKFHLSNVKSGIYEYRNFTSIRKMCYLAQRGFVLNRLVQFNVIRRYVKTNSIHTTHRLNALAAPPGIRV